MHILTYTYTNTHKTVACDIFANEAYIDAVAKAGVNGVLLTASTAGADLPKLVKRAHDCSVDAVVLCVSEGDVKSACDAEADVIAIDSKLLGMDGAVALKA